MLSKTTSYVTNTVYEESERVPRERWDECLVFCNGWPYKQDLKIEDLGKLRGVVVRYSLRSAVWRECAAAGAGDAGQGQALERLGPGIHHRNSHKWALCMTGEFPNTLNAMHNLVVTEEDRDDGNDDGTSSNDDADHLRWAKRSAFPEDTLMHTHDLLATLLPASYLYLPSSQDRAEFSNALLFGHLLCLVYNVGVR